MSDDAARTSSAHVVVGVDGSEGADLALEEAIREARLREAKLTVISAWQLPVDAYGGGGFVPPFDGSTVEAFRAAAERLAGDAAERARGQGVECEPLAVEGQAAS